MDNFGGVGTRKLLASLGIKEPLFEFTSRAVEKFPQICSTNIATNGPTEFKIYSYAEFNVTSLPTPLVGDLFRENGCRNPGNSRPRWLRAVPLPINIFVERELCAEFQLLEAVCNTISAAISSCNNEASREKVFGNVDILISSASCVSCVGAIRQFQLLWPAIHVTVGMMCRGTCN